MSFFIIKTTSTEEPSKYQLQKDEGLEAYLKEHGYHFTERLADDVCKEMENQDGTYHIWTSSELKQILEVKLTGVDNKNKCTTGDLTYLSNMAYADFYPGVISEPDKCINYAIHIAVDPDGYEGIAFSRWLSDVMMKKLNIAWADYV